MAKELKRASFISRFFAYVVDMVLIALLATLVSIPFTNQSKVEKISNDEKEIRQKYIEKEITPEEYLIKYGDITYELIKTNGTTTFFTIIIAIGYFVVFQLYNKGQTIGKKLLKIKVISIEDELTMNQMIFRSLLSNSILLNIISFGFLTFASKYVYIIGVGILEVTNYIIILISIILATTKEGRTIHDRIAHTRVISIK